MSSPSVPEKTHFVLKIILLAFLGIVFRVWHLGVVLREEKLIEAQKPQQRTLLVRADRGTICDRFHIPLALNRICYNASIYYSQISQIPIVTWRRDEDGKKVRHYARKEYIKELSQVLASTLQLDATRIEDLIHSKASLFPHVPFILKAGLSEEEHYRLKNLEREWLGIHAEIAAERFYPLGKTASHLIGTMGAINAAEFSAIAEEVSQLQEAVERYEQSLDDSLPEGYLSFEAVYRRLHELKEKAYTLNDLVGKTGIEAQCEEELRGFYGKKKFEVDQKGRFLRELPGGKSTVAGKHVVLSISSELQQFAEGLLAQDEKIREGRSIGLDPVQKSRKVQKQPWIKGGAIVAIDPKTAEVVAMASYPRFDPNDFIPSANPSLKAIKQKNISRALESERAIGLIWDGKEPLVRERLHPSSRRFFEETQELSWDNYLETILPKEGPLYSFFQKADDVKTAIQLQEDFETLFYFSEASDTSSFLEALFPSDNSPAKASVRATILDKFRAQGSDVLQAFKRFEALLSPIPSHLDKLFVIDLCRVAVYSPAFTDPLIAQIGSLKLSTYRALCQSFLRVEEKAKNAMRQKFHQEEFPLWKEAHQKAFLAEKRKQEKERKTYARPYIEYLDQKEKELFEAYWQENRLTVLSQWPLDPTQEPALGEIYRKLPPSLLPDFLRTFRSFHHLDRPLLTTYKNLRHRNKEQTEKDLAAAFYPIGGFGFSRSHAFQTGTPQGSLFKLITAYEGLHQNLQFSLIDEIGLDPRSAGGKGQVVAYTLNRTPYPRYYKGGRLPRSSSNQLGKVDLLGAIEQSSNPYFSILAGDYFQDPEDLGRAAALFGYGEKTGIDLPAEVRGNIPSDLKTNKTGLYSTAIGQHTLLNSPLQSALMLAAFANGGQLLKPYVIKEISGPSPNRQPLGAFEATDYLGKEELAALGIHYPLFTGAQTRNAYEEAKHTETQIRRKIPLPPELRTPILEGMDRVIWGTKGSARPTVIKNLLSNPVLMREYLALQHQLIGKTGTAEIPYNPYIHPSSPMQIYKHIWFGAIAYPPQAVSSKYRWDDPELVVIVYLRYGDSGKEAAPIAAQMVRKWREIKKKHQVE